MDDGRIDLLGCPIDAVDLPGAVHRVVDLVSAERRGWAVAMNAAKFVRLRDDAELRAFTRDAALVIADGASILGAARLQGAPLPERVTGADLCGALVSEARRRGWRTFLLGARPEVVEEAARRVGPAGWHDGYFADPAPVLARIRAVRPHLLFVAMGTPRQEHFLAGALPELDVPFAMGVGGTFDVLAGRAPRAPAWLGDYGLEWAWRLAREPRRRWRRAVVDSARFVGRVARRERLPR